MAKTFEVWSFFRNELIGSTPLFYAIGLFVILYCSLKYRLPQQATLLFGIIWSLGFFAFSPTWKVPLLFALFIISFYVIRAYDIQFFQSR